MIRLRHGMENGLASFDITGGSLAQDTAVPTFWLECERMIERCNPIDQALGNMQLLRNEAQRCVIKIADRALHRVERFDKSIRGISIFPHGSGDHSPSLFLC